MIFASTSCLKGVSSRFEPDIIRALNEFEKAGIKNIELGAAHSPMPDVQAALKKCLSFGENFIIHANFPPLPDRRMLNIGTADEDFAKKIFANAKLSIDTLNKIGGSLFSLHYGNLTDTLKDDSECSSKESMESAVERSNLMLARICDYAQNYGINVAFENSPYSQHSISHDPKLIKEVLKSVSSKNLGVLLDLGHAKLTEIRLGIPMSEFAKLQDNILEFHCHNVVNGIDHQQLKDASIFNLFGKDVLDKAALTLESNSLSISQIQESLGIMERFIE